MSSTASLLALLGDDTHVLNNKNHSEFDEYNDDDLDKLMVNNFNFNFTSETIQSSAPILTMTVLLCDLLGALCLLLNTFVIVALIRYRRRVLNNVFYVIVLHCALVDLIRGSCLIVLGMPHLLMNNMSSMDDRLLALKVNQMSLFILRSCNLLTIFNLLIFTTNEFIVIRYPLYYRRWFRRKPVLFLLLLSWLVSLSFGIGSVLSNFLASSHSIVVFSSGTTDDEMTKRRELPSSGWSTKTISMLMIFFLCCASLLIVLICYGSILRTIKQYHSVDDRGVFHSSESQRIDLRRYSNQSCISTPGRCNSIRRWRLHFASRHKYLLVIGTVLFVDLLFLFPYSGIQVVAVLHLNNLLSASDYSTIIRWALQVLIGVHSVLQPLCYFRMREFRRLVCCSARLQRSRSRSFSQIHRSFGPTRMQCQNEEKMESMAAPDPPSSCSTPPPPLIIAPSTTPSRQRMESPRFRSLATRPGNFEEMNMLPAELLSDLRSSVAEEGEHC